MDVFNMKHGTSFKILTIWESSWSPAVKQVRRTAIIAFQINPFLGRMFCAMYIVFVHELYFSYLSEILESHSGYVTVQKVTMTLNYWSSDSKQMMYGNTYF